MPHQVVDLSTLPADTQARFQALTRINSVSWPSIALWLCVVGSYSLSWVGGLSGWLPLWVGMLINCVAGYYAFSITHDGIHRSIARNPKLNDAIAQSAVILGAPYVSLALFRWAHSRHHRFANSPRDPDTALHGPVWSLPLRWMLIDLIYFRYILRFQDAVARRHLRRAWLWTVCSLLLFGTLIATGHGMTLLMLWLIPSRVLFLALGFAFFWLPHVPHDTRQEDNFTRATTVRLGHEWLLGPLLQGQNYHLIHHLWPTTPFYNYRRVWRLLELQLRRHELSIQHGLAIQPRRTRPSNAPQCADPAEPAPA